MVSQVQILHLILLFAAIDALRLLGEQPPGELELDKALGARAWRGRIPYARRHPSHLKLAGKGEVYEFGVFDGASMRFLRSIYPNTFFWGFDSFDGLPPTTEDVAQKLWSPGTYKTSRDEKTMIEELGGPKMARFIRGFYNESLTATLQDEMKMKPAEYIDIDCDLHVSSKQALDWVFANGIAVPGTLVGYDDWWVNPCSVGGENISPLESGEGKAHAEIMSKYNVQFTCVAGPCGKNQFSATEWGVIFVIESIGNSSLATSGFEFTTEEINEWKQSSLHCRKHHQPHQGEITSK